ncbi:competence type IV pilus minor pilin ComGG [Evansella sp. AB-rgal1]|uniref:competence type IV pilus minor pilin ComGG n=1 Tax=Evansella sp. AB-rgal1 TaxID=3242696 RepID=UPI00359E4948
MNIVKQSKGYALLITIFIMFLLSSTFMHYVSIYRMEKSFLEMEQDWNNHNHLLMTAMQEVLLLKEHDRGNLVAGNIDLQTGTVNYQIVSNSTIENTIFLYVKTNEGQYRGAKFTYNNHTGEISNWVEGAHIK